MSSEQLLVEWLKDEHRCSHLLGAEDSSDGDNHFGGKDGISHNSFSIDATIRGRVGIQRLRHIEV